MLDRVVVLEEVVMAVIRVRRVGSYRRNVAEWMTKKSSSAAAVVVAIAVPGHP